MELLANEFRFVSFLMDYRQLFILFSCEMCDQVENALCIHLFISVKKKKITSIEIPNLKQRDRLCSYLSKQRSFLYSWIVKSSVPVIEPQQDQGLGCLQNHDPY